MFVAGFVRISDHLLVLGSFVRTYTRVEWKSKGRRKARDSGRIHEASVSYRDMRHEIGWINDVSENNGRNGGNVPINRYSMHGNWFLIMGIKLGGNNWNKDLEFSYTVFPRERKTSCVLINPKNWKIILFFFFEDLWPLETRARISFAIFHYL